VAGARTAIAALALAGALATGCGGGTSAADTTTVRSNDQGPAATDERTADPDDPADERTAGPGERDDNTRRGPDDGGAVAAYGGPSPDGPSPAPE